MAWKALTENSCMLVIDEPPTNHTGETYAINIQVDRLPGVLNTVYNTIMDAKDNEMGSQATLNGFEKILNGSEDPS